ncbi:MAG: restriction endonuclease [Flavobacteriia bacterium]|nr:restriction endonuclease [Flavobacteriia bacterium]OJX35356.1 MAG: hypothetical protein BGO87_12175 [Flavobacteriia bacterium 40-80]
MKITLSEHSTIQVFQTVEELNNAFSYLNQKDFSLVKISERRKFFSKVFPYQIVHNTTQNCYDLQADYYIGLDWLVKEKKYIQVEPKINRKLLEIYKESLEKEEKEEEVDENTDKVNQEAVENAQKDSDNLLQVNYLKMLLDVYTSRISPTDIGKLVEIYWDDKPIEIQQKEDQLTPFLVVQFLGLLKIIVRKGLKKSYYKVQENLTNRVKGKILVGQNTKQNTFKNRLTSTFCEYQVFGEDSLENQFLKKVYQFCLSYVQNNQGFFEGTKNEVDATINFIRPAFEKVSNSIRENQLKNFKHNPFFKEYKEAIRIGNFILKQFSYNISSTSGKEKLETPPFWIDMPCLFELYVYQKLLEANSIERTKIQYQFKTYGNHLDILVKDGINSIVIDAKYKLHYKKGHIHQDIRQVSGYARLKKVRKDCGLNETDDTHIKCLIIYPVLENGLEDFSLENIRKQLDENEIKAYHKVYKLGVSLPVIA